MNKHQTPAQVKKINFAHECFAHRLVVVKDSNGLVSVFHYSLGRNLQKTISPWLGSKSTSGFTEFSEYFITSHTAHTAATWESFN